MSIEDFSATRSNASPALPESSGALRSLVIVVAALELVRVVLMLLLNLLPPTNGIDPATGFVVSKDPLGAGRPAIPFLDDLLYAGAVAISCVVLARLASSVNRRRGAIAGFVLAGLALLSGLTSLWPAALPPALLIPSTLFAPWTAWTPLQEMLVVTLAVLAFVALLVSAIRPAGAQRESASPVAVPGASIPAPSSPSFAAQPTGTNGLAIASLIVVFFSSPIGLILGHVALAQIRRTRENGRGLALTAVIVGWISVGVAAILLILVIAGVLAHGSGANY